MDALKVIAKVINQMVGIETVAAQDNIKLDLGLDSLSIVSLIIGIEDELAIEFDESDLDPSKLETIADLIKLVEKTL